VTTSELPESEIPQDRSITVVQRPNIGYDFYSYRVGVDWIRGRGGCKRLFLLNSSFLVTDREIFARALQEMIDRLSAVAIAAVTQSHQWEWHLQSYLLLLREDALTSDWFKKWLAGISPQNTKFETILKGEFGLSQTIVRDRVASAAIFRATRQETYRACRDWGRRLVKQGGLIGLAKLRPIRHLMEFNPVHFAARPLAERCGLVKAELLRSNPHGLDIGWVNDVASASQRDIIRKFVERSQDRYQPTDGGLTTLRSQQGNLPSCRLVYSGPLARPGVEVAVVVHVFYPELIPELCDILKNIVEPFDLFVTTPHEAAIPDIFDDFGPYAQSIAVALAENRGRDIGPFMSLHRRKLLEPYQAILKLHTKRSAYSDKGGYWRQRLFRELCGDSTTVQRILDLLRRSRAGIVGPHDYYLSHQSFWGGNREKVGILLKAAGVDRPVSDERLGFFSGSMFWYNPAALAPLHSIPDDLLIFEPESGQQDATLAHAFERIFCDIAREAGYVATSLVLEGEDVDVSDTDRHSVPVLAAPS
jgi:hypothetical protein